MHKAERIVLENDVLRLEVVPQWGGRVACLRADDVDILVPLRDREFDPLAWPRAGA
ncbi:hypothetical protein AWB79_02284 [Caballeronia hypogeia]|uniref:Uncharacterized protein n=1 Tax=Caballeronia hypogeia TaxID=1777140 RepID=A0A158AFD2_9BURK|nr:hypothetical protein [Caballeronia hypogeia]SAK56306.1 hypothetical protein AWB79_02284 [Caballeronia hypogeia]